MNGALARRAGAMAAAAVLLAACPMTPTPPEKRTYTDTQRGVTFTIPDGWILLDNEARSAGGSLVEYRVFDLRGAQHRFVERLPGSMFRKLEGWTRYYFIIDGKMTYVKSKVGNLEATRLDHPVRVRKTDPLSRVNYWLLRVGERLYVIRAVYAPRSLEQDEPQVEAMLASFRFQDAARVEPLDAAPGNEAAGGEVEPTPAEP